MLAWAEVCRLLQSSKSPPSQASYAVLLKNHWPDQAFFKHSLHTNSYCISNSAILHNNYISLLSDLCACIHVKKNGVIKEAIVLQWVVRIASCDFKPGKKRWTGALLSENAAVLCENHREWVTQIWTSPSEEEEEEATFWFGTFAMLFSATGCVVCHENTRRWTVGCYNGS